MEQDEYTDIRKLADFPEEFKAAYPRDEVVLRNMAECPSCGEIIESTHRHHFKSCGCGGVFVDGGTGYLRRGWRGAPPIERSVTRPQTDEEWERSLNSMWDLMGPPGQMRTAAFLQDTERLNALVGPGSKADELVKARNAARLHEEMGEVKETFSEAADYFQKAADELDAFIKKGEALLAAREAEEDE